MTLTSNIITTLTFRSFLSVHGNHLSLSAKTQGFTNTLLNFRKVNRLFVILMPDAIMNTNSVNVFSGIFTELTFRVQ